MQFDIVNGNDIHLVISILGLWWVGLYLLIVDGSALNIMVIFDGVLAN